MLFFKIYKQSEGTDGFVSLEVDPFLANNTEETIKEAKRLWNRVNRENLMIKIPGTDFGFPAIQHLLESGININITLFAIMIAILLIGLYLYYSKQYKDHSHHWNWIKFFFGVNKCSGV